MTASRAKQIAAWDWRVSSEKRSTGGPQKPCETRKAMFLLSFSRDGAGPSTTSILKKPVFSVFSKIAQIGAKNRSFPLAKSHLSFVPKRGDSFPFVSRCGSEKWSTSGPQNRWLIFEHSDGRDPPPFPISNFSS